MRSMNWKEPVVDDVIINGKSSASWRCPYPGVPVWGNRKGRNKACGGDMDFMYSWQTATDGAAWKQAGQGEQFPVPGTADFLTGDGHRP